MKSRFNLSGKGGAPLSPGYLFLYAVWFGLATGFSEGLMLLVRRSLLLRVYSLNPHWFWMRPVANLVLFCLIAVLLLALGKMSRRFLTFRFVSGLFGFLLVAALLFMAPGLYRLAGVVLALGAAVRLSLYLDRHKTGFAAFARRSVGWLALAAMMLCAGIVSWPKWKAHQADKNAPAASQGAPNVLLLVMDTVRAQSLSLYGYDRATTPRLEEFAKESVVFDRAFSTSPWTLPSHASFFTGRLPHELFNAADTPFNAMTPVRASFPTLAQVLSRYGYATAGFVANMSYCSYAHGLGRGFGFYDDYTLSLEWFFDSASWVHEIYGFFKPSIRNQQMVSRKSAADVNGAFLKWLDHAPERPFFAFLNYFDAHDPYIAQPGFAGLFKQPTGQSEERGKEQAVRAMQDQYDRCIAYLDGQIGKLLDELRRRRQLDNTLVIVVSDHGEQFGEHGLYSHGNSLYTQNLHVPLMIRFPRILPEGLRISEAVSLQNLPATIAEILGLNDAPFSGVSLANYWRPGDDTAQQALYSEFLVGDRPPRMWKASWAGYKSGIRSVIMENYHYIRSGDGREELYRIDVDPEENDNLAAGDHPEVLSRLQEALHEVVARSTASN